jgi:hypothetical protein
MRILQAPISINELDQAAQKTFGNMVKAVVDIGRKLVAVDAELHSDLEALLLEDGSEQKDLWGINLYPDMPGESLIEFDSMINLRPSQGNRTRGVDSPAIQKEIKEVISTWVKQ